LQQAKEELYITFLAISIPMMHFPTTSRFLVEISKENTYLIRINPLFYKSGKFTTFGRHGWLLESYYRVSFK